MQAAMKSVQDRISGVNQAATDHGVPKTTLKDRLSGRVIHGINPGPRPYLNKTEELELSQFLKKCSSIGYGKTRKDVMSIVGSVAINKGVLKKGCISLVLRKGDSTAYLRMDAETLNQYYDLLEDTLKENNLMSSPSCVYNVDETGMPLDPKAPKVVAPVGTKKVRYQSPGRKGQITVVACGNAAGQVPPPTIIFDAKKVKHAWTKDEIPGTKYGVSDKGWINTGLFESWFNDLFLPNVVGARPLLLLLDGHSSHYQPDVINLACKNEVIILCLPTHTTHATQPLDCGIFSPLKAKWSEVCHKFFSKKSGKIITKFNFNSLFSQAWLQSLVPANLISGFKTCGIYPLNRNAVKPVGDINEKCSTNKQHKTTEGSDANEGCSAIKEPRDESGYSKTFSSEQEELFKKRFEEGYDLCIDPEYNAWLKIHHPESLVDTTLSSGSVVAEYLHVTPMNPIPIDTDTSSEVTCVSLKPSGEDVNTIITTTPVRITTIENHTQASSTVTVSTANSFSCVLVDHTPKAMRDTAAKRSIPKARLLMSAESLALLQEEEKNRRHWKKRSKSGRKEKRKRNLGNKKLRRKQKKRQRKQKKRPGKLHRKKQKRLKKQYN